MNRRQLLAALSGAALAAATRGAWSQATARVMTTATEAQASLLVMRAGYRALTTRYGAQHPEVQMERAHYEQMAGRLRGFVARGQQVDRAAVVAQMERAVAALEGDLARLRVRYGEAAPEVVAARANAESCRESLREVATAALPYVPAL